MNTTAYIVSIHANGIAVTERATGKIIFESPDVTAVVDLDGATVDLYESLYVLQDALDSGELPQ